MSITYHRLLGRDVWHFHPDCQHMHRWFRSSVEIIKRTTKPRSGELCNECQAKTRADKRTQARKRGK